MVRFSMLFTKGFLFYAFFNLRLFFFLLTRKKADVFVANDLDTLPGCYLASVIRRLPLVYDSHEYFTEIPELTGRPFVRKFWKTIEQIILPRIKTAYTVSSMIAGEYRKMYGTEFTVIRNLPEIRDTDMSEPVLPFNRENKRILIYQGSLNKGRGIELMLEAVCMVDNIYFIIAGEGDLGSDLREIAKRKDLQEKVHFTGRIPMEKLRSYTLLADAGISFEEDMGLNYRYALPNKLFDYIAAGLPVIVSPLPEMAQVVRKYNIGIVGKSWEITELAGNLKEILFNDDKRALWKENIRKAASELSWETEKDKISGMFSRILGYTV